MTTVIAHVAGVPIEEALLPVLSGLGAGLLLVRAWVGTRVRRPRPREAGNPDVRHDRRRSTTTADDPLVRG